jgi:plastocyanin
MTRLARIASAVPLALVLAACSSTTLTDPQASSTQARNAVGGARTQTAGSMVRSVIAHDICDPATFDAAVGPGTCVRSGGMKFDQFIRQLTRHGDVQGYDFSPPAFKVSAGETILVTNNGGEVHTFTQVAAFGGGIVPLLNQLSNNPVVAPECTTLSAADFIASGAAVETTASGGGPVLYQCCIHPWMRAIANP